MQQIIPAVRYQWSGLDSPEEVHVDLVIVPFIAPVHLRSMNHFTWSACTQSFFYKSLFEEPGHTPLSYFIAFPEMPFLNRKVFYGGKILIML